MKQPCTVIHKDLTARIENLATEISNRESTMCASEAKVLYDDLISLYEKYVENEAEIRKSEPSVPELTRHQEAVQSIHSKVTDLKAKLAKIISPVKSTPSTKPAEVSDINLSEKATKLDLLIRQQKSLIKRIESLEMIDDICATKAEVLHNLLSQLHDSFISNQIQVEASIGDASASLENQQKITADVERKVIDFQTRLKKIIQPSVPMNSPSTDRSTNNDDVYLVPLIRKRDLLIKLILELRPIATDAATLSAANAKVLYNHVASLYNTFKSNQHEIIRRYSVNRTIDMKDDIETSIFIQSTVIKLQTAFKNIYAQSSLPSLMYEMEAFSPLEYKLSDIRDEIHVIELKLGQLPDGVLHFESSALEKIESISNDIFTALNDNSNIWARVESELTSLKEMVNKAIN